MVLLLTLTACGGQEESSQQEAAEVENTPIPTEPPPTATPVPPTPTAVPPTETPEPTPIPTEPPPAESNPEQETDDDTSAMSNVPLPLPEDAEDVLYEYSEIIFTSPSDINTLVEFYRDILTADNWEEDVDFTDVSEDLAFVEFTQADEYIYLTVFQFDGASDVSVDLSGAP